MGSTDITSSGPRAVLFVDVLGFAQLTRTYPDVDRRAFAFAGRATPRWSDRAPSPLERTFAHFHDTLGSLIQEYSTRIEDDSFTAISFSDCAFVATPYVRLATEFAARLMRALIPLDVPTRMGIAYGTFRVLRFQSDIGFNMGVHAAQFLGSAVVFAHDAERSGCKGMRILLHTSLRGHHYCREGVESFPVVSLPGEHSDPASASGLLGELNYLDACSVADVAVMREHVHAMSANSDARFQVHYLETLTAMDAMHAKCLSSGTTTERTSG